MEVDLIFKIAAIGIIAAVMNQVLAKSDKGEYAMLITLAGIVIVVIMIIPEIEELFSSVEIFSIIVGNRFNQVYHRLFLHTNRHGSGA